MSYLVYEKINESNIDLASYIQETIFPSESARPIYEMSLRKKHDYFGIMDYYIVFKVNNNEKKAIGVTGIYSYSQYPDDAWLGYYGVLPSERNHGYGSQMLDRYEEEAKLKGFKNIRLYTNKVENPFAYVLYEKHGMSGERYTNFPINSKIKEKDNEYVYSKSLTSQPYEPWNNKMIVDFELFF